jgi:hypothetical protein
MTRNGRYIFAGVAAATIGLAAAGALAERGGGWGPHGGFRHGGSMGFMGFGGPGFGRFCRGDSGEMADHILIHIEHKVKPTDAQKGAFEDLKTATKAAAEKMRAGCPQDQPGEAAEEGPRQRLTPIQRLDRVQARLEATLDAIKTVRPAAEKFYASLSDDQKAKLTERRGPWGRGWHRPRGDDGEGPEMGPGTPPPAQQQ